MFESFGKRKPKQETNENWEKEEDRNRKIAAAAGAAGIAAVAGHFALEQDYQKQNDALESAGKGTIRQVETGAQPQVAEVGGRKVVVLDGFEGITNVPESVEIKNTHIDLERMSPEERVMVGIDDEATMVQVNPEARTQVDIQPQERVQVDIQPQERTQVDIQPQERVQVDIQPQERTVVEIQDVERTVVKYE